jgi:hypothetical protein
VVEFQRLAHGEDRIRVLDKFLREILEGDEFSQPRVAKLPWVLFKPIW